MQRYKLGGITKHDIQPQNKGILTFYNRDYITLFFFRLFLVFHWAPINLQTAVVSLLIDDVVTLLFLALFEETGDGKDKEGIDA